MVTHKPLRQLWRSSACYDDNERLGGWCLGWVGISGHFESRTLDQNTHLHLTV